MQKLKGEELKRVRSGGDLCCWGGPDDGCDCTGSPQTFHSAFEAWLNRMDRDAEPGGET
jgi:hypothetical protein